MTPPRCGSGSPRRTPAPARRSTPAPTGAGGTSASSQLMQRPVVMAVQVRGDRLFCLERPAGAEQFLLTRRSAIDPGAAPRRAARSRPSAPPTRPTPSTGSRRRPTARWSPSAPARAAARTRCCECSTAPTARDRGEAIPDTRACSVAWEPDGSGFAYTRYPPGDQYHRTVHHHVLGAPWADDPVVWAEHPDPQAWPDVTIVARRRVAARARAASAGRGRRPPARTGQPAGGRPRSPARRSPRRSGSPPTGPRSSGSPRSARRRGASCAVPLDAPGRRRLDDDRRREATPCSGRWPSAATTCWSRRPAGPSTRSTATGPTARRSARSPGSATSSPSPG